MAVVLDGSGGGDNRDWSRGSNSKGSSLNLGDEVSSNGLDEVRA